MKCHRRVMGNPQAGYTCIDLTYCQHFYEIANYTTAIESLQTVNYSFRYIN